MTGVLVRVAVAVEEGVLVGVPVGEKVGVGAAEQVVTTALSRVKR